MALIDTNILIYSGQAQFASILIPFVTDRNNFASVISIVETLGFQRITPQQIAPEEQERNRAERGIQPFVKS
jgi:hypothetical protein